MIENKFNTSIDIPITYIHLNKNENKPVLILFHGFGGSANSIMSRLYPEINEKYEILAINGPFIMPQKIDGKWKPAYAWYFHDLNNDKTHIVPEAAVNPIKLLIEHLNLKKRTKLLIGFSQGGFFIPHLLPQLNNVKHIICIGSLCRTSDYSENLNITIDAFHGTNDEVISFEKAKENFELLKVKNPLGKFTEIINMEHPISEECRGLVQNRVDQIFS